MINDVLYQQIQREVLRKHFDANDTMFLERQITQLRAKLFEVRFPDLVARSLMPFAKDIAPSANQYSYEVLKPIGAAKYVANNARDLPRVDVVAREVFGRVHPIGLSYGWTINDLAEAARTNVPISEVKARVARSSAERQIDEILTTGDLAGSIPQTGLQMSGIANNADVAAQGIQALGFWLGATPLAATAVLNDLNNMVASVSNNSLNAFTANTLVLPVAHYNYASQTPFSGLNGESILSVFKRNNENVTLVRPWYRLNGAGVGGVPRSIAYQRDETVLEGVVPQEFEQLPPEIHGLEIVINCTARAGGVKVYQPLGMKYGDFATS